MVTIYNCHSISVCILWIVCFCIKRNGFKVAILRCVRSFPGKVRTLTLPPLLRHDEITWGEGKDSERDLRWTCVRGVCLLKYKWTANIFFHFVKTSRFPWKLVHRRRDFQISLLNSWRVKCAWSVFKKFVKLDQNPHHPSLFASPPRMLQMKLIFWR